MGAPRNSTWQNIIVWRHLPEKRWAFQHGLFWKEPNGSKWIIGSIKQSLILIGGFKHGTTHSHVNKHRWIPVDQTPCFKRHQRPIRRRRGSFGEGASRGFSNNPRGWATSSSASPILFWVVVAVAIVIVVVGAGVAAVAAVAAGAAVVMVVVVVVVVVGAAAAVAALCCCCCCYCCCCCGCWNTCLFNLEELLDFTGSTGYSVPSCILRIRICCMF